MENKKETWSQRIDRYLAEGRTVSGGCGPSDEMKRLNAQVISFAGTVAGEAQTIFGDASSIFNDLKSSLSAIVKGGPNQQGWGAAESSAITSQIVNAAASSARNLKAAAGQATAAIGGGNVVTPAGLERATNLQVNAAVEAQKSANLTQATIQNYETGRQNYFQAVAAEKTLPDVFGTSTKAAEVGLEGLSQAEASQSAIDAASNWWQPLAMSGIKTGITIAASA